MMQDAFRSRLIATTRTRLYPELRGHFDALDREAQEDIAVTFLWVEDRLPLVFEPQHCAMLNQVVQSLIRTLEPSN